MPTDSVRVVPSATTATDPRVAWQQAQHQAALSTMAPPIPQEVDEIIEDTPEVVYDPDFLPAQEEYTAQYRSSMQTAARNPAAALQQINQARANLAHRMEQIEKTIKFAKRVRDWGWRIFGRGSPVEAEGAMVWTWFGTGSLASLYQGIKAVIAPGSLVQLGKKSSGKADDGQFLKGILSFLEPSRLEISDRSFFDMITSFFVFLDGSYILVLFFLLFIVFIFANVFMVFMGAIGLALYGFADLLGTFGSWLTSLF